MISNDNWLIETLACLVGMLAFGLPATAPGRGPVPELSVEPRFERIIHVNLGRDRFVDGKLRDDIAEELARAERYPSVAVVLQIDSGGGEVVAAQEISALIRSYRESEAVRVFAWVPRQAYSAAAWIALSCRGLFIAPDATIGNVQPLINDYRGYELAPGKIVSPLAEKFVITCQDNGITPTYPRLFLEQMVDREIEIVAVYDEMAPEAPPRFMRSTEWFARAERERQGFRPEFIGTPEKALTTNGRRMLDFGFSIRVIEPRARINDVVGTADAQVENRGRDDDGGFGVQFDWSWLLLIMGVVCLVMEFKTPGLGVFGIAGIAAIVTFFFVQAEFSNSAILPVAIFLVGAFLFLVEALLFPGLIIPGILGLAAMLYATWLGIAHPGATGFPSLPDWNDRDDMATLQSWAVTMISSLVGGASIAFIFGKTLHRIPLLGRMVMRPRGLRMETALAKTGGDIRAADGTDHAIKVGDAGRAHTTLRPAGIGVFDRHKVDVVTQGGYIDAGRPIRVVEVHGNRVVVKAARDEEISS